MRKNIVAGNWKMNLGFEEAEELVNNIAEKLDEIETKTTVIICPDRKSVV